MSRAVTEHSSWTTTDEGLVRDEPRATLNVEQGLGKSRAWLSLGSRKAKTRLVDLTVYSPLLDHDQLTVRSTFDVADEVVRDLLDALTAFAEIVVVKP